MALLPEPPALALFIGVALGLLVTPGPAVLYVVARSLHQGRRAGVVSSLGLNLGGLVHVVAATLGLSAVLMASAALFQALKLAGAAYLVFLGVRTLLERQPAGESAAPPPRSMGRIFREGVLVNVLNPKAAVFFFAFLPQFADPARGPIAGQVLVLGLLFLALALATDCAYALVAGSLARRLRRRPGLARGQRYVTGTLYIGLGLAAALAGQRRG